MRLAIADPPYLGRARLLYSSDDMANLNVGGNINPLRKADAHPDAHIWDDPDTHQNLVTDLMAGYDGWAIAMAPDNLRHYLQWVPARTRIAVWHDPAVMPTGTHPRRRWEPVLIYVPEGRRRTVDVPHPVGDVLTIPHQTGTPNGRSFAGRKPPQWTRWVLDMLGHRDEDTVTDLFHGSGAVAAETAQLQFEFPPN